MTRVFAVAALFVVGLTVANVQAQCASCSQGSAPVFTQNAGVASSVMVAPTYVAPIQNVQVAAPISTGCGCSQATYVSAPAPIVQDTGCGCGASAYVAPQPVATCGCAAPVVSTGCDCCDTQVRARRVLRVRGSRRADCCNPCCY